MAGVDSRTIAAGVDGMLSHLRVLDLTDGGSGLAGQMLADHGAVGATPCEGPRALFSRTPARIESGAATLGQHNALVLGEILGLTDGEISDLVIAGALE